MSTPAFLALSLACGGALFALLLLIGKLLGEPLANMHHRWLERRLSRRLVRGSDRYFEELRSLETALVEKPVAARKPGLLNQAMIALFAVAAGMQILTWTISKAERPGWTEHVSAAIFIVIGAQWVTGIFSFSDTPTRGSRALGVAMVALFSMFLIHDLNRHL